MFDTVPPRREVRLVDVPVAVYRDVQQHTDALLRELVLMAEYETSKGRAHGRIRALFDAANAGFADRLDLTVQAAPTVECAMERGDAVMTLVFSLPDRFAASAEGWSALVDELDGLCRDGTMLCVPASDEVREFSAWWCSELARQLRDGAEPTPWPAFAATRRAPAGRPSAGQPSPGQL